MHSPHLPYMMLVRITSPMSLWSQHNHNINKSSQLLVYTHTNLWWAEIETKTLTFLLLHFFQIILSYKRNTRFRFVVWCLLLHIDLKVLLSVSERPLLWAPFPTGRGRLEGKRKGAHNNQESEMQRITYTVKTHCALFWTFNILHKINRLRTITWGFALQCRICTAKEKTVKA